MKSGVDDNRFVAVCLMDIDYNDCCYFDSDYDYSFDSVVVVVDIELLRVFPRKIFLILIVLVLNRYHYQFQINDIMIRHNWLQFPFKKLIVLTSK
jgi:hypothetical protein